MGKNITYQKLPRLVSRLVMGRNLDKMFQWVNTNGGVFSAHIKMLKTDFPDLLDFQHWIKLHFKSV